jgi:hypothetical protein
MTGDLLPPAVEAMIMAGNPKSRYSGALNEPIVRWSFRLITAEPNEQRIIREWLAKVDLLLAH